MLPDPRPYFAELGDPRRQTRNRLHKLQDIVMIVLCAVISGVEDWVGMQARRLCHGVHESGRMQSCPR